MPGQIGRAIGPPYRASFPEASLSRVDRGMCGMLAFHIAAPSGLRHSTSRIHQIVHQTIPIRIGQIGVRLAPQPTADDDVATVGRRQRRGLVRASSHAAVLPYSCRVTGWLDERPPSTAIAWPLT